jgi:hypothetical protein
LNLCCQNRNRGQAEKRPVVLSGQVIGQRLLAKAQACKLPTLGLGLSHEIRTEQDFPASFFFPLGRFISLLFLMLEARQLKLSRSVLLLDLFSLLDGLLKCQAWSLYFLCVGCWCARFHAEHSSFGKDFFLMDVFSCTHARAVVRACARKTRRAHLEYSTMWNTCGPGRAA